VICDHYDRGLGAEQEGEYDVAGNVVVEEKFVADDWDELEDCEEPGGEDGGEVHNDTNVGDTERAVPVAFAGGGAIATGRVGIAEYGVEVEIFETGEGEAEEGAIKDEEEDEVVAFGETQGVVNFAHHTYEGVLRGIRRGHHCDEWMATGMRDWSSDTREE
jgi:hypothetical protein